MNILVTGATGFIGIGLSLKLANLGHTVYALYRSKEKAQNIKHQNIKLFKGDITNIESVKKAMMGCDQVYHIAAFTEVWSEDNKLVYKLNVEATENILKLALELGVKKLVFTSTAGVFGPTLNGQVNEETQRNMDYFLEYERTKDLAEEKVREYVKKGLNAVIVNPTRVYGPGLLGKTNGLAIMIKSYSEGKWRVIPGNGKSIGNYVYIDNVIDGHILAMEKGKAGQRYILGGDNISYIDLFKTLRQLTGQKHWMFKLPLFLMLAVAHIMMFFAKVLGIKPLISPPLVRKFNFHWNVSSNKAINQLDYQPYNFKEGASRTLDWIKEMKHQKN